MKKLFIKLYIVFAALIFSTSVNARNTEKEELLIAHVEKCISLSLIDISNLSPEILTIEGQSSPKIRHFLNNLCTLPETNYFEVGVWKGSTWVSALYNNDDSINSAIAIDNWSDRPSPAEFFANCETYLPFTKGRFYESNCFKIDKDFFSNQVNIFFYDGDSSYHAQKSAFLYFDSILDDCFIAVLDDWNFPQVEQGTKAAFKELGYQVLLEYVLPARYNGDREQWWNGLYVAVIRK